MNSWSWWQVRQLLKLDSVSCSQTQSLMFRLLVKQRMQLINKKDWGKSSFGVETLGEGGISSSV